MRCGLLVYVQKRRKNETSTVTWNNFFEAGVAAGVAGVAGVAGAVSNEMRYKSPRRYYMYECT